MAKIKKIYKGGVEYEIAGNEIDSVTVDYQEDGGSPNASAQFESGTLAFSLKNMKMKFSDLTAAEKAEITGPQGEQGDSAVYNPEDPDAPDFVMANTTGQSTTKAMTQKAVTDAIEENYALVLSGVEGNLIEGKALNNSGEMFNKSGWGCYKEAIPCTSGDTIAWTFKTVTESAADIHLIFYNENMVKISHYGQNSAATKNRSTTAPADTAYVNASFQLTVSTPLVIAGTSYPIAAHLPSLTNVEEEVNGFDSRFDADEQRISNLENVNERRLSVVDNTYFKANGTTGGVDGWAICNNYIPCEAGASLVYKFGAWSGIANLIIYNSNNEVISYYGANTQNGYRNLTAPANAAFVRISFCVAPNGVTNTNPITINGVDYIVDEFSRLPLIESIVLGADTSHGIIGENYPEQVADIVKCGDVPDANYFKRLHFLHTSDNHNDIFGYADDFLDYCPAKFLVNTGDLVNDKFTDARDKTIAAATSPSKPVYLTLGNHDYNKAPSKQDIFNAFYGDPLTEGTVNHHNSETGGATTDKTYYSIDDASSMTKCIFLDINDGWPDDGLSSLALSNFSNGRMSQTQIEWFISQLQAAKASNYHVCVFVHLLADKIDIDRCVVPFTDNVPSSVGLSQLTFLHQLVDGFINGGTVTFTHNSQSYSTTFTAGGNFVAWFYGHAHWDMAGWLKNYPKQFGVCVLRPNRRGMYCGSYDGDKLGVHFNFVSVDTAHRSISVYRVGQQKTVYGVDRKNFRIFY